METRYIFPLKAMRWSTLQTDSGATLKPGNMKAVGFIPIYESLEAMVDDHGTDVASGTMLSPDGWVTKD